MYELIIITESFLNLADYRKFGVDYYLDKGLEVKIWNLAKLFRPDYYKSYYNSSKKNNLPQKIIEFETMPDLFSGLDKINKNTIVFCNMSYLGKEEIFKILNKRKIKFGFFLLDTTPQLIRDIFYYFKITIWIWITIRS